MQNSWKTQARQVPIRSSQAQEPRKGAETRQIRGGCPAILSLPPLCETLTPTPLTCCISSNSCLKSHRLRFLRPSPQRRIFSSFFAGAPFLPETCPVSGPRSSEIRVAGKADRGTSSPHFTLVVVARNRTREFSVRSALGGRWANLKGRAGSPPLNHLPKCLHGLEFPEAVRISSGGLSRRGNRAVLKGGSRSRPRKVYPRIEIENARKGGKLRMVQLTEVSPGASRSREASTEATCRSAIGMFAKRIRIA